MRIEYYEWKYKVLTVYGPSNTAFYTNIGPVFLL